MIVIGNLSGYYGYRELARFMERHAWEFVRLLGFKHGVPGHVTIRDVLSKLDFESFKEQFQAWLRQLPVQQLPGQQLPGQQLPVQQLPGQPAGQTQQAAYSLDGKSLKSTLSDYWESYQDFVAMVQVFSHQDGLVIGMQAFHNGKQGEAQVVRNLIQKVPGEEPGPAGTPSLQALCRPARLAKLLQRHCLLCSTQAPGLSQRQALRQSQA